VPGAGGPPPADVIASVATPPGAGALAVIRMSGEGAVRLAAGLFRGGRDLDALGGFEGAHGWIHGREGPVDEVVAWVYRAPRSYTGEEMVELSCHGGGMAAARVLEVLREAGARPAAPGEFTRRAFLAGRLDLAQAEAVVDLIAARGRRAHDQALLQLRGGLSTRVRGVADAIRDVLAGVEAHLDFGEDVPRAPDGPALARGLEATEAGLRRLAGTHASSRRLRDGMTVALAGRPNVGKSSLLNALAGWDRALVHATPGTTRDTVDVVVEWAGIPVRLVDTAGLRETPEPVEREGISRSRDALTGADVILWVADASERGAEEAAAVAVDLDWARTQVVWNKMDLVNGSGGTGGNESEGRLEGGHGSGGFEWVNSYSPQAVHRTSAKTGQGVPELHRSLEGILTAEVAQAGEGETFWVTNDRHAHELAEAAGALARAREILAAAQPLELAAADLHRSLDHLAAITGDRAGQDLLDLIFRRFCIGK